MGAAGRSPRARVRLGARQLFRARPDHLPDGNRPDDPPDWLGRRRVESLYPAPCRGGGDDVRAGRPGTPPLHAGALQRATASALAHGHSLRRPGRSRHGLYRTDTGPMTYCTVDAEPQSPAAATAAEVTAYDS